MRFLMIAGAATMLLLMPAGTPANACEGSAMHSTKATSVDYSAAKKKKEKVEYMRSAAGPEPKAKKTKKHKKNKKKK